MFHELDTVRTLVRITEPDVDWPAGTVGTIVDITDGVALVEVDLPEADLGHRLVGARLDELEPVVTPAAA
jgi:hypothetical protein